MRINTHKVFYALVCTVLVLAGCASHRIRTPVAPAASTSYLDVQPGWRLRVITPLLRSGGYRFTQEERAHNNHGLNAPAKERASSSSVWRPGMRAMCAPQVQQTGTNAMTLSAGKDFMGYETSYYLVRKKRWAGLDIQFLAAEATRDGTTRAEPSPTVKLFQIPRPRRHVRLIYLRRVSQSDHDMAVLAASNSAVLANATKQVQTNAAACHDTTEFSCSWIPAGIAVIAERRQHRDGAGQWISAR